MTREEFIELSPDYAAGALDGDNLRRFEQYLQTASTGDLQLVAELVGTASLMPLALEMRQPPAHLKENLMQKIAVSAKAQESVRRRLEPQEPAGRPPQPVGRRSWLPFGVTFVALAMILGFSLYVTRLMTTLDEQHAQLVSVEGTNRELSSLIVALKNELERKEELLMVLAARQVEIAIMHGLPVHPIGYGKIIWDPDRRVAILQVSNLPAVPDDRDYQLWVVKGKQPVSAGVFSVSDTTSNYFKIENLSVTDPKEIAAFAVTLEPKGGVPQPTGAMYIAGSPRL